MPLLRRHRLWQIAVDAANGTQVWSHQYNPSGCIDSNGTAVDFNQFGTPMDFILGPHPRILVGAVLICLFAGACYYLSEVNVALSSVRDEARALLEDRGLAPDGLEEAVRDAAGNPLALLELPLTAGRTTFGKLTLVGDVFNNEQRMTAHSLASFRPSSHARERPSA